MIKLTSDRLKVWKNVKEDGSVNFTYSISTKKQDGSYDYMSKKIKFMKDKAPSDTCEITILNSFQSFYEVNGIKYDYLMVTEYAILSDVKCESYTSDEVELSDEDLPF